MYVRHIARYTGFGLGQEQPIVLLPSSPTVAVTTPTAAPLVAFGQPISWNAVIVGAGVLALAWVVFSGTRKARRYVSGTIQARKAKAAKRKSLQAQLAEL